MIDRVKHYPRDLEFRTCDRIRAISETITHVPINIQIILQFKIIKCPAPKHLSNEEK